MLDNIVDENRKRDLWLSDPDGGVVFIPQGWCDAWSYACGHTGGLDWTPEHDDMAEGPEIYCYAPSGLGENPPVETLFVLVASLQAMSETTETEARSKHPALFQHLDAIDETAS